MQKLRYKMGVKSLNTKVTLLKWKFKNSNNVITEYIMQMKLNQCLNV